MIKILEKLIQNRLKLEDKNLLNQRQNGFRPFNNTHQHIRDAIELGLTAKEQNYKHSNYLFVDFQKAFDSINHRILSEKINKKINNKELSLNNGKLL